MEVLSLHMYVGIVPAIFEKHICTYYAILYVIIYYNSLSFELTPIKFCGPMDHIYCYLCTKFQVCKYHLSFG